MLITLFASAAMAAQAQAPTLRPVRVAPINKTNPVGPGGGCDSRKGRGIIVQGGLDPKASGAPRPGSVLAIGPKQDDPLTADSTPSGNGVLAIGPKQDDPLTTDGTPSGNGVLAIGPKQDDPSAPGSLVARPGDDEDPQARAGMLAIGPKQDDPRAPGSMVARPGDDEDPQALAASHVCVDRPG
jgi:hypothetical protein